MSLGIFRVIGIILFLYLTWRNLKEDYAAEDLVTYGWVAILGFLVVGRVAFGLLNWGVWNERWWDWVLFWEKPGSNLAAGYFGLVAATAWWCEVKGWKLWAFLEDVTPSLLIMLTLIAMGEKIVFGGVLVLGYFLAKFLAKRYRSFVWYCSGKKGFVFWAVNLVIWLVLGGLSRSWLLVVASLISLGGLVILGGVLRR